MCNETCGLCGQLVERGIEACPNCAVIHDKNVLIETDRKPEDDSKQPHDPFYVST